MHDAVSVAICVPNTGQNHEITYKNRPPWCVEMDFQIDHFRRIQKLKIKKFSTKSLGKLQLVIFICCLKMRNDPYKFGWGYFVSQISKLAAALILKVSATANVITKVICGQLPWRHKMQITLAKIASNLQSFGTQKTNV